MNKNILDELSKFVKNWSTSTDEGPEHVNELLFEVDLATNKLNVQAINKKDNELFQLCSRLQNNIELLQESAPSHKQLKLLCDWPTYISKFLADRDNKEAASSLKTFLCDSNWPTECYPHESHFSTSSRTRLERITREIEQLSSTIEQPKFFANELFQENEKISNGYTSEQQELLDLINIEIAEIQQSSVELLADLNKFEHSHDKLLELLEIQIDQFDRIGSAAEIIGLHGLYLFCLQLQKILVHILKTNPKQLINLQSHLLLWPDVVQAYLFAPNDSDYIQAAVDFLNQDCWPITVSLHELNEIEAVFRNSAIEVDTTTVPERLREATADNISLAIPKDVNTDLVNSLLLDLSKQTEEFSSAVQKLRNENFMEQLEIAKRIAHTLKGAGNTVGIIGIANLTHNLEDILEALLKAHAKPDRNLHLAIQNAADCLEEMSEFLHGVGPAPGESVQIFQEILNWANSIDEKGIPQEDDLVTDVIESPHSQGDVNKSNVDQEPSVSKTEDTTAEPSLRISAHLVDDLLKRAGENVISNAQIQELVLNSKYYLKLLNVNNNKIKALAQELENLIGIQGFSTRLDSQMKMGKFDPLEVEQFNELHTFVNQLMETSDDSIEFSNSVEEAILKLEKLSFGQVRNLRENQDAILRIRMIPVASIVPRLKRCVRQACKLSNKYAQLEISGEQTQIDSEFLNLLVDPLMHLLRNAVDHGIETPEFRVGNGKNAEGKIQLDFRKEGNLIHVECKDDGYGLDLQRIKSKAVENGLIKKSDEFSKDQAVQLIMRHGFSTKDEVSQISGRGVGLDVVYTNIHEMKGTFSLDSDFRQGVKVELTVPTTINSIHALIVSCAGNTLTISNRGIEEILYPGSGNLVSISGRHYFEYNQHRYPVFDLQTMLYENQQDDLEASDKATLIIQDDSNNMHAIMIDKVFDTRDIVIKPFSRFIPKIAGLLGTTILGDGSVTTVIDLIELLNTPNPRAVTRVPVDQKQTTKEIRQPVLIVEDAISTRKSLAQFMRDLGFEVKTAKDGVEAINLIQKQLPSIVLTDLEMPRMNGLELSDHLRSNKDTANTPIVMITSRSTDKHKKEAERLGVTAYITKPYDEDQLLELINSLGVAA